MNRTLHVMTVFGTRPEAIKMAPLVKCLQQTRQVRCSVCVTAQHREQLDSVLRHFEITPDYDLNIMEKNQTLASITTKSLGLLDEIYKNSNPDFLLVHGDTLTTFVASLAAFFNKIPVGHVEAGLRTWDKYSPFPEEIDRQLTGVIADLHFAPTQASANNLLLEGKSPKSVFVTGNTVIDAITRTVSETYQHSLLETFPKGHRMIYMTAHRRENLGSQLEQICYAVLDIIEKFPDVEVVYPVHLNPHVREVVFGILSNCERIHLIEPLDVIDSHNFMARSHLILTDSGGIQEEAPYLGVPCLVLRDTTERPEGIDSGSLKLVGTDRQRIVEETSLLLTDSKVYEFMSQSESPYGDGKASERIVSTILHLYLGIESELDVFNSTIKFSYLQKLND